MKRFPIRACTAVYTSSTCVYLHVLECNVLKTHSCGDLRADHIGKTVTLAGWVHRRRDHGGLVFIDLRDRGGVVQVTFNPELAPEAHKAAGDLRNEWVLQVSGVVQRRPAGTENANLPTGQVEVVAQSAEVLNPSQPTPFSINEDKEVDEMVRLRYRYLDLRRERMQRNLVLRYRVVKFIRDFLDARGFLEIETPILIKSTPEGARDYLVPSRITPGHFYALPQSPQQLKQLLMVAGFEKYFQIARCFRDEDLRADRQPEFTQLDLEMSFVDQDDVLDLMEDLYTKLAAAATPHKKVNKPFARITYDQAMDKYGTDKPDLRFGLELAEVTGLAAKSQFGVFKNAVAHGGIVKGLAAPGCAGYTRKQIEELTEFVKMRGAQGLVTIALEGAGALDDLKLEQVRSVAAKFLTLDEVKELARRTGGKPGDLLLFLAGEAPMVNAALAALRNELGRRLALADPDLLVFARVTDFPLLEWNIAEKRWEPARHPFTSPHPQDVALLDTDPSKVRAYAYDVVCNGWEIGSGSIRIHRPELQVKVFKMMGYTEEQVTERFGHLLEAFTYGAPPHGGFASGIDRVTAILADTTSIREVIAFPKTQSAADLLFGAPSQVSEKQLRELHLAVKVEAEAPKG